MNNNTLWTGYIILLVCFMVHLWFCREIWRNRRKFFLFLENHIISYIYYNIHCTLWWQELFTLARLDNELFITISRYFNVWEQRSSQNDATKRSYIVFVFLYVILLFWICTLCVRELFISNITKKELFILSVGIFSLSEFNKWQLKCTIYLIY